MTTISLFPLNDVELGYLFFQKREKKGITIKKASIDTKLSRSAISKFENGKQFLSMNKILKYAEYLDLNLKFCIES